MFFQVGLNRAFAHHKHVNDILVFNNFLKKDTFVRDHGMIQTEIPLEGSGNYFYIFMISEISLQCYGRFLDIVALHHAKDGLFSSLS